MELPNLFTSDVPPDPDDIDGFRTGSVDISKLLGSGLIVKLMEIEPGNHLCPYHYEYVEEWLVVVSGVAEVRVPAGTRRLDAGGIVCFPTGPDGAHQVSSPKDATEPTRVLMFSQDADPAICVYPDSDKMGIYNRTVQADDLFVRRSAPSSHLDYYDGETP